MATGDGLHRDDRIRAGDQRPREQRMRVAGYDEQCFEFGPHDGAACRKGISGRAGGSGHENTVATEGRYRSAVDLEDNFENSQTRTVLDAGLVERPPAVDDLVVHPNHDVECHTGLDAIFLANYLRESLVEMLRSVSARNPIRPRLMPSTGMDAS